jgi:hypothetical protein
MHFLKLQPYKTLAVLFTTKLNLAKTQNNFKKIKNCRVVAHNVEKSSALMLTTQKNLLR